MGLTLDKPQAGILPDSIKDIYKNYSHGLEAIYTLEAVDPKSIRIFSGHLISQNEKEQDVSHFVEPECEFDLGEEFRLWAPPFFPEEPIQALGLSLLAEKALAASGKRQIKDLLLFEGTKIKGVGGGHQEEIQKALNAYIQGRSPQKTYRIDYAGWLRSLFCGCDRKKARVALEEANLESVIELTPAESMELKRQCSETRRDWAEEAMATLVQGPIVERIMLDFKTLINAFLKHWMVGREGIATGDELIERMIKVAQQKKNAQKALIFILESLPSYFFPFDRFLFPLEPGLYAAHPYQSSLFGKVIERAKSYFYEPDTRYPLFSLITLLLREFCMEWESISPSFIERALMLSPSFRVRKGPLGKTIVQAI